TLRRLTESLAASRVRRNVLSLSSYRLVHLPPKPPLFPYTTPLPIYHSMQLKVQKPFTGGQNILVSYTVSKLISDVDSISGWLEPSGAPWGMQDWYNRKADRSVSNFDVPQRLVASYVLDVPVGRGKRFLGAATGPANKLVSG